VCCWLSSYGRFEGFEFFCLPHPQDEADTLILANVQKYSPKNLARLPKILESVINMFFFSLSIT
jgi:hypothetical protein